MEWGGELGYLNYILHKSRSTTETDCTWQAVFSVVFFMGKVRDEFMWYGVLLDKKEKRRNEKCREN